MKNNKELQIDTTVNYKEKKIKFRVVSDLGDNWFKLVGCEASKNPEETKKVITIERAHITDITIVKTTRRESIQIENETLLNNAVI